MKRLSLIVVAAVGFALPAQAVEIQRVTSPGGIEAWLVESHTIPVIAVEFAFDGGIELDPPGQEGLANMVSITLDEGAGDLDSQAFQTRLADAAIDLDYTAGTDQFFGSLKTVSEKAPEAFELLRLSLNEPRFDEAPVERMRDATQSEIQRRVGDPDWMSRRVYYELAFGDHPYGRPSRGTADTLAALTIADLRRFVDERFARDNLTIAVAGDIDAAGVAAMLDQVFGTLPEKSAPFTVPEAVPEGLGQTVLVERAGAQSVVLMAQPGVDYDDPDYWPAIVMNHILGGGGFGSRLTLEVRENRGLAYGIGSYLANFDHSDLYFVSSQVSNANVAPTLEVIRAEWARMRDGGVTAAELADAQAYLTGSFPLAMTSTDDVAGILLGMQLDDLGIDYIDRRQEEIDAVTVEQIADVASRLLDPEALTTVVVGAPPAPFAADVTIPAAAVVARELGTAEPGPLFPSSADSPAVEAPKPAP